MLHSLFRQRWWPRSSSKSRSTPFTRSFGFDIPIDPDSAQETTDLWHNSAVGACLHWLIRNFAEPPLVVTRGATSGPSLAPQPIPDHPITQLLATHGSGEDPDRNHAGVVIALACCGNAYLWKRRGGTGQIVALTLLPHINVTPTIVHEPLARISGYRVWTGAGMLDLPPTDVIHIRLGVDPRCPALGLAPLATVLREILSDNLAAQYTLGLLKNFGVPPVIYSPEAGDVLGDPQAARMAEILSSRHARGNAGRSIVSPIPLRAERLGFTPDELALERIRDVPESRICAMLGIHPMTVGLSVGARQRTYNNQREAERHSQLNGLVPLQKIYARALTLQLLPEFSDNPSEHITWDWSTVPALRR